MSDEITLLPTHNDEAYCTKSKVKAVYLGIGGAL